MYTYFVWTLILLAIWLFMYYKRRDLRDEMIAMGLLLMALAVPLELLWTMDWWQPQTLTGTRLGIEDLLFGFTVGGIVSVLYEFIFSYKLVFNPKKDRHHFYHVFIALLIATVVGLFCIFVLGLHSWIASVLSMLISTIYLLYLYPHYFEHALMTGFLLLLISIPTYWIITLFDPGFIMRWWFVDQLTTIFFLGVPFEDWIWLFLVGMNVGPMYEIWKGGRLIRLR